MLVVLGWGSSGNYYSDGQNDERMCCPDGTREPNARKRRNVKDGDKQEK